MELSNRMVYISIIHCTTQNAFVQIAFNPHFTSQTKEAAMLHWQVLTYCEKPNVCKKSVIHPASMIRIASINCAGSSGNWSMKYCLHLINVPNCLRQRTE